MDNKSLMVAVILTVMFVACQSEKEQPVSEKTDDNEISNQHLVMATAWYQQSAEMQACYYQAFKHAKLALEKHVESDDSEKPNAVVLDIDETLLDNSPFQVKMIRTGKPYSPEFWKEWTDKAAADALPGALDFLNYAVQMDVDIFYISNRRTNELEATMENMKELGFPTVEKEHILLKSETSDKTARRNIVKNSHDIILLIGDNLNDYSDFMGEREDQYGKNTLKKNKNILGSEFIILPNPMYGDWVDALRNKAASESYDEFIRELPDLLQSY
ncbi:MAG TPA: 5'-nucleotidase, lipoprotein e(P4) family [Bacteroidales bacterium]|nr:5'-nucleotidase, lipoprotein e(P4) family [Bacteroidales bacterium]